MFNRKTFEKGTDSRQFFGGCGSFGEMRGTVQRDGKAISLNTPEYSITCTYEHDAYGVFTRRDLFVNRSDKEMIVNGLKSRFVFEGGEYEVYTQFCNWQTENMGQWQPLVTSVSVGTDCIRDCQNAAPFMALWSAQEQRGVALHLLPESGWSMKATRVGIGGKKTKIVVELGISDYNFAKKLAPGESLELPELICYEVKNKIHLDCYKLHNYLHTRYPRRLMPMMYNTWLYRFDNITFENLSKQIPLAADLGLEYFFIDAGWFGKGKDWFTSVGDWEENQTAGFQGRMLEFANQVRAAGMKFGIWLEPERAHVNSDAVKNHPEYYLPMGADTENLFLDFGNPEAREWMLGVLGGLIEHYGVEYIKDDFNAHDYFDVKQESFISYHKGQREFIKTLRERYPQVYLCSCAGGGMRMELDNYKYFDSTWPSDNESPYTEMEMYRHGILRLPPQAFERWAAIHSITGLEDFYKSFGNSCYGSCERLVACADATWTHIDGVMLSYLKGYMTGGPIGFSCDLSLISETVRAEMKAFIAKMKEERAFWMTAVARVLCATKTLDVYQYSDMALNRAVIQVFTNDVLQETCTVHPELDAAKSYRVNGEVRTGAEIQEEGIEITLHSDWADHYPMFEVILEAV